MQYHVRHAEEEILVCLLEEDEAKKVVEFV
jgi:hypothetical protein